MGRSDACRPAILEGVQDARVIQLPERGLTKGKSTPLTERKRPVERVVLSRTLTFPASTPPLPRTGQDAWRERFERGHVGVAHTTHKPIIPQEDTVDIGAELTLPRRTREGSITDEQIAAIHKAVNNLTNPRGAVVVADGMGSENSARNKARSAALLHEERYAELQDPEDPEKKITNPRRYLTAHAVEDPANAGKWIAAVSIRAEQKANKASAKPPAATEDTPAPKAPAKDKDK